MFYRGGNKGPEDKKKRTRGDQSFSNIGMKKEKEGRTERQLREGGLEFMERYYQESGGGIET